MSIWTFLLGSLAGPFLAMAVIAPWLRTRRYRALAVVLGVFCAMLAASMLHRYATPEAFVRAVVICAITLGCGWAYERWFMDRDRNM